MSHEAQDAPEFLAPPREFMCPLSLKLMRDPVTLCSGATYEKKVIQEWLKRGNDVCPDTTKPLSGNHYMFPNQALQNLILTWCAENSFPTDKPSSIDNSQVERLLDTIAKDPKDPDTIRKLKNKARESVRNTGCIVESGAHKVLCSVLRASVQSRYTDRSWFRPVEECVSTLVLLPPSTGRRHIVSPKPLKAIVWVLRDGTLEGKRSAVALLDGLAVGKNTQTAIGSTAGLMEGLVDILRRNDNMILVNTCLRALLSICLPLVNRVRLTEAGAVGALGELLLNVEGGVAEHVLMVLVLMCGTPEGRQAIKNDTLAVRAVIRKVYRAGDMGTDLAIEIIWTVCDNSWEKEKKYSGLGLYHKIMNLVKAENLSFPTRKKTIDILDRVYNCKL